MKRRQRVESYTRKEFTDEKKREGANHDEAMQLWHRATGHDSGWKVRKRGRVTIIERKLPMSVEIEDKRYKSIKSAPKTKNMALAAQQALMDDPDSHLGVNGAAASRLGWSDACLEEAEEPDDDEMLLGHEACLDVPDHFEEQIHEEEDPEEENPIDFESDFCCEDDPKDELFCRAQIPPALRRRQMPSSFGAAASSSGDARVRPSAAPSVAPSRCAPSVASSTPVADKKRVVAEVAHVEPPAVPQPVPRVRLRQKEPPSPALADSVQAGTPIPKKAGRTARGPLSMEECDAVINSFMDQGVLDDPESINTVNEAMADLIDHVAKTAEVI